ncbi:MAG: carboxypeptidase regulatory-like domain-containing protein [Candidatus Eremiobacteraeota bacterium]|nr:carboxypeptidase regulatory-like domain-containing protein [Candidatus Eremiobacteraeota bacterium]
MRYAVLGMLLLFALGDGCSPTPGVVGVQDYGQVTGRVLDAMTNRPIPSALVSVGSLYTASTDPAGAFTLARVPAGDQTVTARAPGYDSATADTTVLKDQAISVGYVRLVPSVRPQGVPTLPPPATPTPAPTSAPTGVPSGSPAASAPPVSASPSPAT